MLSARSTLASILACSATLPVSPQLTGPYHQAQSAVPTSTASPSAPDMKAMLACRYGLGQIAFRQEKWESAIFHFRSSIKVGQLGGACCLP